MQSEKSAGQTSLAPRKVSYEPGLDGLRAVALLSIFAVHANIGWASGGFLAVSTFFTLSGFLIMALLVKEREASGRVDLPAFWKRRALRLLPASLLAILLIATATIFFGDARQVDLIGGDAASALAYFANWRFIFQEISYAGEFGGQSPLLHFWSLAIEEQFYLLFPLVMAGAMALASDWRKPAAVVLIIGITLSLTMGIMASLAEVPTDRLYFRTDIRAGELLVGALFGHWWMGRGRHLSEGTHQLIRIMGSVLLVVMVLLIATSDYHDRFWYQGGLIAYSLITVGVILAAVETAGPVRQVLSWRPLVAVGVVSYGAYLVHWPLFMWLYTETSFDGPTRLIGGTAAAILLAAMSHRWVELPVRQGKFVSRRPQIALGAGVAALSILVAFAAPQLSRPDPMDLEQSALSLSLEESLEYSAAQVGEAPTVGVFGDSTALLVALALVRYDDTDATLRAGRGWAGLGCTLSAPAQFIHNGREISSDKDCAGWLSGWQEVADAGLLDVAVLQFGPWEVKDTKTGNSESYRVIGEDPIRDEQITQRITQGIDALNNIPLVIIMTSPYVETGRINGRPPSTAQPDSDPARMDRLNEIIIKVANGYDNVAIVDLGQWLEESADDNRLRPDGVHFSEDTARELAPRYVATIATIAEVFAGGTPPAGNSQMFPVLRYIKP